jgi:hypothetical protein
VTRATRPTCSRLDLERSQVRGTIAGLTLAAITASGCATSTSSGSTIVNTNGPLGPGGDSVTYCMAKGHASSLVVGVEVLHNSTSDGVTLDEATLVGADGVHVERARVAEVGGNGELFGRAEGDPPQRLTARQRDLLATSKPLGGYRMTDHGMDAALNVLLFLRLDSPTRQHDVEHVRVYYHTRGGSFVHQDNVHDVAFPGDQCPK